MGRRRYYEIAVSEEVLHQSPLEYAHPGNGSYVVKLLVGAATDAYSGDRLGRVECP